MIKETITYTDYNGVERTEDFYFHLNERDITKMASSNKGLDKLLQEAVDSEDPEKILDLFETLVLKSYGEKSEDGRSFIKDDKKSEEFLNTAAYNELFIRFLTDNDEAIRFVNGIVPSNIGRLTGEKEDA